MLPIYKSYVPLEEGKMYHLQSLDGNKFIFDHSSRIEPWPSDFDDCVETEKTTCLEKLCSRIKNKRKRKLCLISETVWEAKSCKKKGRDACADSKEFEKYVSEIIKRDTCERAVCNP